MEVSTDWISSEVERIVGSVGFSNSPRLVGLLRYCVELSLLNQPEHLKESTIGVAVFGREPGYDPKADPIVRVTAGRLREKLDNFYRSEEATVAAIQIPKGGYVVQFVCTPRASPSPEPNAHSLVVPKREGKSRYRVLWLFLPLTVTLLLCGLIWLVWLDRSRSAGPFSAEPLARLPGFAEDPAWSPDGAHLAFTWDEGTGLPERIYLMKPGGSAPYRLSQAEQREYRPAWSPDGRRIAFLREADASKVTVVIADLARKTERILHFSNEPASEMYLRGLDWSPDGDSLVTSESPPGGGPRHLILISTRDGSFRTITDPPIASTGDVEARFSPDGRNLAFRRGSEGTLFLLSLAAGSDWQPVQLTRLNSGVRGIAWSADGDRIYFGSQQNQGYFGIWSISRHGGEPVRVTQPGVRGVSPSFNAPQHRLAFSQPSFSQNLWLYSDGSAADPRILVPSTGMQSAPALSPDGKTLAFVSSRSGPLEVWLAELSGGSPRRVSSLADARMIWDLSWSSDGSSIIYTARRTAENEALQTNVATGVTLVLRHGASYSNSPQCTPDGRFLLFFSNMDQRYGIWRQETHRPDMAQMLIPDVSGSFRLSHHRRSLFFLRGSETKRLVRWNMETNKEQDVFAFSDNRRELRAWDITDSTLFYVDFDSTSSEARLVSVDLARGVRRTWASFPVMSVEHWQPGISVSPDGHSVVLTRVDHMSADLLSIQLRK